MTHAAHRGILVGILAAGVLFGIRPRPLPAGLPRVERQILMDTVVAIHAFPAPGVGLDGPLASAFARMHEVERNFTAFDARSPLAHLSERGSMAISELPGELVFLLDLAGRLRERTGGLFEPAIGRVVDLWGFGPSGPVTSPPDPVALAAAVGALGPITRDGGMVHLATGTTLDLGGLAKGYAVDEAVRILRAAGVPALVDAGGDLACTGPKPDGRPWTIGIQHPRDPGGLIGVVELASGAVVTSGDYERSFVQGGVRYHHLLDPRTGRPGRSHISATVAAPTCAVADGWSTALFLLGPGELARRRPDPGVEALLVLPGGELERTPGFRVGGTSR